MKCKICGMEIAKEDFEKHKQEHMAEKGHEDHDHKGKGMDMM